MATYKYNSRGSRFMFKAVLNNKCILSNGYTRESRSTGPCPAHRSETSLCFFFSSFTRNYLSMMPLSSPLSYSHPHHSSSLIQSRYLPVESTILIFGTASSNSSRSLSVGTRSNFFSACSVIKRPAPAQLMRPRPRKRRVRG